MKIALLSDLLVLFVSNRLRELTRPLKDLLYYPFLSASLSLSLSQFLYLYTFAWSVFPYTCPPGPDSFPFPSGSETDLLPPHPCSPLLSVNPAWEISNTSLFTRHLKSRRISMIRFRLHRSLLPCNSLLAISVSRFLPFPCGSSSPPHRSQHSLFELCNLYRAR